MSAQLENGYTRIANEILEQIARTKLNGTQFRLLMAIWRYTYGFNKREAPLSVSYLSEATGINKRQVQRELNALIEAKVIVVVKEATFSSPATLGFNKYHDQWCLISHLPTKKTAGDGIDIQTGDYLDTPPGDGLVTPPILKPLEPPGVEPPKKAPKEIYKENIKESNMSVIKNLFEFWKQQGIIVHEKITPEMKKQLQKALLDFSEEQIKTAIANYGTMFRDPKYEFCDYAWGLDTFLSRQKGYKLFMTDGERWINYQRFLKQRNRASPANKPSTAPKCDTTGEKYEIFISPARLEELKLESG